MGGAKMAFVAWTPAPFPLSNQQWDGIRKAGGLPAAARADIEAALGEYRQYRDFFARHLKSIPKRKLSRIINLADQLVTAILGKDSETRAKLSRMCERDFASGETATVTALKLTGRHYSRDHDRVVTLANRLRRDAFAARLDTMGEGGAPWPPSPLAQVYVDDNAIQLLYQCCWHVEQLRYCAQDAARGRATKAKRAASLSNQHLVELLDDILLRYTRQFITRSYKQADLRRCVELCFGAVNSRIGSGSIDKAIQAFVTARRALTEALDKCEAAVGSEDE